MVATISRCFTLVEDVNTQIVHYLVQLSEGPAIEIHSEILDDMLRLFSHFLTL